VRVSVNVYGFESEYVGGADMVTATLGGLGAELRVLKMSVSCPPVASHRISPVDTDADSGLPFAKESVKLSSLAGQCEIALVGLKRTLYFFPGRSAEVTNGSSWGCGVLDDVKWT
jgi:hypothetical protein